MILLVLCASYFLLSMSVSAVEVSPCKSGVQLPTSVEVGDCNEPPCPLRRGEELKVSTVFTADDDYADITLGMTSKYMGITQGYPGVDGTVQCDNIYSVPDNTRVGCPLQKGETYRHELAIPLTLPAPKLTLPVEYSLKDKSTKKDFVCFELMVTVH